MNANAGGINLPLVINHTHNMNIEETKQELLKSILDIDWWLHDVVMTRMDHGWDDDEARTALGYSKYACYEGSSVGYDTMDLDREPEEELSLLPLAKRILSKPDLSEQDVEKVKKLIAESKEIITQISDADNARIEELGDDNENEEEEEE